MKKTLIILCLLSYCLCNYSEAGSPFRMGSNAREIALSNSLVAHYNSGFNAFGNPALLNEIKNKEYGISMFNMSLDRSIQTFSFSMPLPPTATLGLSLFRSSTNDITGYDNLGNPTGVFYSTSESFVMASFAMKINKLSAGVNLKLYRSELADGVEADGIGFDVGVCFDVANTNKIGLKLSNIASKYNWSFDYHNFKQQYEEEHPMIISFGSSSLIDIKNGELFILTQIDLFDKNKSDFKMGFEYKLTHLDQPFYFRAGSKMMNNNDFTDYNFTFGFGIPIKLENFDLVFDYAVDPGLMNQGVSHIISFAFLN